MPANDTFTVQRLRGGFALVWQQDGKRRRRQLAATDRQSAEAEAREQSPYLADKPGVEGNRAERRKQAAKNRKGSA